MRPTDYNGQIVDKNTKESLETQFAGEFLRFAPQDDGFVMQAKLPDFGKNAAGEQFHIRRNINYFMRGAANFCLDENGQLDLEKMEKLSETFFPNFNLPTHDELTKVAELCQIPVEDRDDFIRFAEATQDALPTMARFISSDVMSLLQTYQYNLEHFDDPEYKQTRQRLLSESYEDYKNTLTAFSEMAHMNANDEKRIMLPLDCRQSALLNQTLLPLVKNYKGLAPEDDVGGPVVIQMPPNPQGVLGGKENKFVDHYCTGLKAQIEGKEQVISLETTAPPTGKLLFAPNVEQRTGVGIYDSREQLEQYHKDNNLVDVPNMKEFNACKKVSWKLMTDVKKCPVPDEMEQEVPVPPRPNAVKRWLNRRFGFFSKEVNAYNKAVSRNDMVRKTKQLSETARISKLSGDERKQEQQKGRLQRKEDLSRQHARLSKQFTDMKKRNIYNIGYRTNAGDGLSSVRYTASRAIFINSMEELYTKGSPQVRDLLGKIADSGPDAMEKMYEIWKKSSDHETIVNYYIDRAQKALGHTIPLTDYLGREDCQIFTNAQKNKEETYGQRELDAYERFTQKCLEEYDGMKKTVPFKHGEMISNLEKMVHTAKQNEKELDAKTVIKQLSTPQMNMGNH